MCADSCFISFEMALDSHQDLEAFLALSQRELCMMRVERVLADFSQLFAIRSGPSRLVDLCR
jgi:hypothetical protein